MYYRVNGGTWHELYYNDDDVYDNWTNISLTLTGFAENYQLGFRQRDRKANGIYIDDIAIVIEGIGSFNANDSDLCANGTTPSNPSINAGTYTWTCEGVNGGGDASCSAVRACAATTYMGYSIPQTNPGATTALLGKSEVITGGVRYSTGAFVCSAGNFTLTGDETHFTTCEGGYVVIDGTSATSSCGPIITGSCGMTSQEALTVIDFQVINEGFESGSIPAGWTQEGTRATSSNWKTQTSNPHSGTYTAYIQKHASSEGTYLITPMMDLSTVISGSLSLQYINPIYDTTTADGFGVYYRVDGGPWHELFYTTTRHNVWTELSLELTGFAENYQLGFRQKDNNKLGIYLDDISVVVKDFSKELCTDGTPSNIIGSI